jgi:hypothetical protein
MIDLSHVFPLLGYDANHIIMIILIISNIKIQDIINQ